MIKTLKLLLLLVLLLTCLGVNSCKKDEQSSISTFLTRSTWNLALLQRFKFVNEQQVKTDILQASCTLDQRLTFNADETFTFSNFGCKTGVLTGTWSLTPDRLYFTTNSVLTQNSKGESNVALIYNLGQYSLVFEAGDINTAHSKTDTVVKYRYGFIHSR